mgnify:CR=1 FL=1
MRLNILLTLFILLSFLFIQSCGDEIEFEDLIGDFANGSFKAIRNGEPWEAYAVMGEEIQFPGTFGITSERFNHQGFARESIAFIQVKNIKSKQELYPRIPISERTIDTVRVFYNTSFDDGDVIGDIYKIVREDNENWIQFTEYDPASRRLKGKFEIHLVLAEEEMGRVPEPDAEPTIDFVDGIFDVLAPEWFELN